MKNPGTADELVNEALEDAFQAVAAELARSSPQPGPRCRIITAGRRRNLSPLLRDEIYRIGRECLRTAYHQANAREVEIEIDYGPDALRVRIRDDGDGCTTPQLPVDATSRDVQVEVWSRERVGMEVAVTVRAAVAYSPAARGA